MRGKGVLILLFHSPTSLFFPLPPSLAGDPSLSTQNIVKAQLIDLYFAKYFNMPFCLNTSFILRIKKMLFELTSPHPTPYPTRQGQRTWPDFSFFFFFFFERLGVGEGVGEVEGGSLTLVPARAAIASEPTPSAPPPLFSPSPSPSQSPFTPSPIGRSVICRRRFGSLQGLSEGGGVIIILIMLMVMIMIVKVRKMAWVLVMKNM